MTTGVYEIPTVEMTLAVGAHQHHAEHRLPRRRSPRGRRRPRAHRRPLRRRDRHGPRRGAAPQPRAAGGVPVHDAGRHHLRLRRLPGQPSRWPSRPPATTSCGPSRPAAGPAGGPLLGIGLATYVEITGPGGGAEFGSTELLPDGRFRVVTGSTPYGQGHVTTWAMLVADRLGVPDGPHRGHPRRHRPRAVAAGSPAAPARCRSPARRWPTPARSSSPPPPSVAADLLEASAADVVFDAERGEFHVVGTPSVSVGWEPRRRRPAPTTRSRPSPTLTQDGPPSRSAPTSPWSRSTPRPARSSWCASSRSTTPARSSTRCSPTARCTAGIAQGVAQALLEEVLFDDDGNPLTSTFADYAIISAAELPSFEVLTMETPTPLNPLGAKGIGESGTIGATPAVQNAVVDALSHLGVRHVDIPLHRPSGSGPPSATPAETHDLGRGPLQHAAGPADTPRMARPWMRRGIGVRLRDARRRLAAARRFLVLALGAVRSADQEVTAAQRAKVAGEQVTAYTDLEAAVAVEHYWAGSTVAIKEFGLEPCRPARPARCRRDGGVDEGAGRGRRAACLRRRRRVSPTSWPPPGRRSTWTEVVRTSRPSSSPPPRSTG